MAKYIWAAGGIFIGVLIVAAFLTDRETPFPNPSASSLPVTSSAAWAGSFSMKSSTFVPKGMQWFYDRFGQSTWLDSSKFNIGTFTEGEYQSLINASSNNESAAVALRLTLLKYFKDHPGDSQYHAMKAKVYSDSFLESQNYLQQLVGELPEQVLDNKTLFMALVKRNPYSIQWASVRLRSDKQLAQIALSGRHAYYSGIAQFLSDKLLGDKQFILKYATSTTIQVRWLKGGLNNDKEVVLAILKKNPAAFPGMGPSPANDPAILSLIRDFLMRTDLEYVTGATIFEDIPPKDIPQKLLSDRELMLRLVPYSSELYWLTPSKIRNDPAVFAAASTSPYNDFSLAGHSPKEIPEQLLSDKKLMLKVIPKSYNCRLYPWMPPIIRNDPDIIKAMRAVGSSRIRECLDLLRQGAERDR